MAGGNGHLDGIDAGAVLRIIKSTGFFGQGTTGPGKLINIHTAKRRQRKVGNGKTDAAQHALWTPTVVTGY